ncbi:hypothetical protein [Nonomuraea sp. NPDC050786]|uniref:hypothetical protein n=1 Tax=Nonomuraea sp. NPDC050786 TaxID=3154840 RepID=UPI0033F59098
MISALTLAEVIGQAMKAGLTPAEVTAKVVRALIEHNVGQIPATSPITCEVCSDSPATQALVVDYPHIGKATTFLCEPCGHEQEPHARRLGVVWRFHLVPVQEVQGD